MSDSQKQNVNVVALTIISVLLAGTVALLGFTARAVYDLNAQVCAMKTQIAVNSDRLTAIEQHGSPVIQAIMVRLDTLQSGQTRIEKMIDDHMKASASKP